VMRPFSMRREPWGRSRSGEMRWALWIRSFMASGEMDGMAKGTG
jgi:hypothetical protein